MLLMIYTTLQILHTISFYLAFFGYIHSLESKNYVLAELSLAAGGMSLCMVARSRLD